MDHSWYRGKKVLISGGSGGLGMAAAKMLVEAGADVLLVARGRTRLAEYETHYDGLDAAVEALRTRAKGGGVHALSLDVTDAAAVEAAVPKALEILGGLDVLILAAGVSRPGTTSDLPLEAYSKAMNVNFMGTVHLTRAFLPFLVAQRRGWICAVSSLAGLVGLFGYSAYAASKFAVAGFADCLRQEMLGHGIEVSVIFPPDMKTSMYREEQIFLPRESKAIAALASPMEPEEAAAAMLEGIRKGRYHIIPGFANRMLVRILRFAPWLLRAVMDSKIR